MGATLNNPAQRIGKSIAGAMLKSVISREVLNLIGDTKKHSKNTGDTIIFRRWLNKNATAASPNQFFADGTGDRGAAYAAEHLSQEGITPGAETLVEQDIPVSLSEYQVLFGYTKRVQDLHEDDVPSEMKTKVGQRLGLVREMVLFGVAKTCTNKFYSGTATSRAAVNDVVSLKLLQKVSRSLDNEHAEKVTSVIAASPNYDTTPVEPAYFVFIHPDLKPDFRALTGFVTVPHYGSYKAVSPYEFGTINDFRIIASPELVCVQDAGASATTNGVLYTTANTHCDVYQMIVAGADAWGSIALRGKDAIETYVLKPGQIDKNDPTGQRGYVGASCYYAAVLKNNLHMAVVEVAADDLA